MSGHRILGPIPVRVYIDFEYIAKQRNGSHVELQWRQPYASRYLAMPVIKMRRELFEELKRGTKSFVAIAEIWKEPRYWWSEEREERAPEGSTRTIIKLFKPYREPSSVQYFLAVLEFPKRSTRMGGYDGTEVVKTEGVLWEEYGSNTSRSGNHGKELFMIIARKAVFRHVRVSNRGNVNETVIVVTPEKLMKLPRYEELAVIKKWCYGRAVRMRDNTTGEEFLALELEYHRAWRSAAETNHSIDPENTVEYLWSTRHSSKTHWIEVYKVLRTPVKVRTTRISGSGRTICDEEVVIQ